MRKATTFAIFFLFFVLSSVVAHGTIKFDENHAFDQRRSVDEVIAQAGPEFVDKWNKAAQDAFNQAFFLRSLDKKSAARIAVIAEILGVTDYKFVLAQTQSAANLLETSAYDRGLLDRSSPVAVIDKTIYIKETFLKNPVVTDEVLANVLAHELGHNKWDITRRVIYSDSLEKKRITTEEFEGLLLLQEITADRNALVHLTDLRNKGSQTVHPESFIDLMSTLISINPKNEEVLNLRADKAREFYSQLPKTSGPVASR